VYGLQKSLTRSVVFTSGLRRVRRIPSATRRRAAQPAHRLPGDARIREGLDPVSIRLCSFRGLGRFLFFALNAAPAIAADAKIATLDVPSMFCALCQISLRRALERLPCVIEAKADNNTTRAKVTYDPDKVSADDLAAALSKSGFQATMRTP
jgi:mercuric ion binding protein